MLEETQPPEALRLAKLLNDTQEWHNKYWKGMASNQFKQASNELLRLHKVNRMLLESLDEIIACPSVVDYATVTKEGIDAHPEQVVVNVSIGLLRLRKATKAISIAKFPIE